MLSAQQYSAPSAPSMAPPTSSTRVDAEETRGASDSGTSNLRDTTPPASKYSSRVERARLANRSISSAARTSSGSPPPLLSSFERPLPSMLAPLVTPLAVTSIQAPTAVPVG